MKSALIFLLVAFPVMFIALATRRFGFTVFPVLGASVIGELLALLLFASYNKWKGAEILSGKAPGLVAHIAVVDQRARGAAILMVCGFGIAIGLLALIVHYVYSRVQSA
jgi:hypothetical protein